MLDNLADFDPDAPVAPADMLELDRWAVTRLNGLIEKVFAAYNDYEFHTITHAVNDFCVVDLSSFYFDILKDRLYCDEAEGLPRRSAQTAIFLILDAMTRLFAPILSFTCDEIWQVMPHRAGDDGRNVLLNQMVQPYAEFALDEASMARWAVLAQLRSGVNAALEQARADKKIGKALEAHVTLVTEGDALEETRKHFENQWADLFIVSDVEVSTDPALYAQAAETPLEGIRVLVSEAKDEKCARCWKHHPLVGANARYPDLCPRCAAVVAKL
jgi:isoleucyl-tRNA synthetase